MCLTLCDHRDCSPPAPLSMEFSRQEYWSGLPFPSPGLFPTQGSNPGLPLCRRILHHLSHQRSPRILEWVAFPSPVDLPNPEINPRSPTLQVDSLPAKPQGKPKNTGVGSLSLLQGIFSTQKSNWGLLHCRWIIYQLSYHRSPVTEGRDELEIAIDRYTILYIT